MSAHKTRDDEIYEQGVRDGQQAGLMDQFAHSLVKDYTLNPRENDIYNKGYEYGVAHRPEPARTVSAERASAGRAQHDRESSGADDTGSEFIGKLIGVVIVAVAVVWFVFAVAIPLILINLAVIFLIAGLTKREWKGVFLPLSLLGAALLVADVNLGWSTKSLVDNVSFFAAVIPIFFYVNLATGLTAGYLVVRDALNARAPQDPTAGEFTRRNVITMGCLLAIGGLTVGLQAHFGSQVGQELQSTAGPPHDTALPPASPVVAGQCPPQFPNCVDAPEGGELPDEPVPASTPVSGGNPEISVSASSVLPPEGRFSYEPGEAVYASTSGAWCEGREDSGVGEWLFVTFAQSRELSAIRLTPGYPRTEAGFLKNNRLRSVALLINPATDSTSFEWTFDGAYHPSTFSFPRRLQATGVRIRIVSVYPGLIDDTCLGGISFLTETRGGVVDSVATTAEDNNNATNVAAGVPSPIGPTEAPATVPSSAAPDSAAFGDSRPEPSADAIMAELIAIERQGTELQIRGDVNSIDKMLAPEFAGSFNGRDFTRSMFLSAMRAQSHIVSSVLEAPEIRLESDHAALSGIWVIQLRHGSKTSVVRQHFTDVFVRKEGRWLLLRSDVVQ